jgi:predicted dehydrogenase
MIRLYNRDQGGGLALDIGCYAIQFALFAFGNEYPEQISVIGWQRDGYGR